MAGAKQWRDEALRALLEERRRRLHDELQRRMARIREDGAGSSAVNEPDGGDADDLDVRLLELTAGTLRRIERALTLLQEGRYGQCTRCRTPIDASRLRAMPFAVRCHPCEMARERELEKRHPGPRLRPLWPDGKVEEMPRREEM